MVKEVEEYTTKAGNLYLKIMIGEDKRPLLLNVECAVKVLEHIDSIKDFVEEHA